MRRLVLRSAMLASAALAALAVAAPSYAAPSYAARPAPDATGQPYCPGPPLGTFWSTTANADGTHTDTYLNFGFPSPGLNIRTRTC